MNAAKSSTRADLLTQLESSLGQLEKVGRENAERISALQLIEEQEADKIAAGDTEILMKVATLRAECEMRRPLLTNLQLKADKLAAQLVSVVWDLKKQHAAKAEANLNAARAHVRKRIGALFPAHNIDHVVAFSSLVEQEIARSLRSPGCPLSAVPGKDGQPVLSSCTAEKVLETHRRLIGAIAEEDRRAKELEAMK